MTQLTTALDTELRKINPTLFGAVSIDLPDAQINLLDGAGVLAFGGRTFTGMDPTYGALAAIEDLTDGVGDEAPALAITLIPASDAAAADLAAPTMQGSPVMIWLGAVTPATGLVVPDPYLLFLGELDVPTLKVEENSRSLDYEVVSVFERFFADDEGARMSPGFHESIWPGELGFDDITGVTQTIFWGVEGNNQGGVVTPMPWNFFR